MVRQLFHTAQQVVDLRSGVEQLSTDAMNDRFHLDRFLAAQESVYTQVLAELRAGSKRSHWIWFIFPQLVGLGTSATSRAFGVSGAAEAKAYYEHPVLGARLLECALLMLSHQQRSAQSILGDIDAMKLRSCATLFEAATAEPVFRSLLDRFYGGEPDTETLRLMRGAELRD